MSSYKRVQKRHSRRRKKRRKLTTRDKMSIVQYREMGHTYNEIADKLQCAFQTVEYTLKTWAKQHPDEVKEARVSALRELAARCNVSALRAIDHITDDSLTHDRVEVRDAEGNITEVKHSGPTGLQIATTAGIMIDKGLKAVELADKLESGLAGASEDSIDDVTEIILRVSNTARKLGVSIDLGDSGDDEVPADYEVLEGGDSEPL